MRICKKKLVSYFISKKLTAVLPRKVRNIYHCRDQIEQCPGNNNTVVDIWTKSYIKTFIGKLIYFKATFFKKELNIFIQIFCLSDC